MTQGQQGHYIVLISIHGLIRGHNLELGRDADTGGQIQYVVELAKALAAREDVWRVDLLTRQVVDPKVSADYAERMEPIADKAFIVRLPAGPRRYLRKEVLWPYLDSFTDHALQHVRRIGKVPDIIHSHYADAGYVGSRLSSLLGVTLVHTGHSLGRVKRERLLEQGVKPEVIETQYNIGQRIEAEEVALDHASMVVASTRQEVEEQYSTYDNYQPKRMQVIPPGVDLRRFRPATATELRPRVWQSLRRFLTHEKRPIILALSRADERKNIQTLVRAYGERPSLRELANLVIVAGNRDDIQAMERGPRQVLTELLLLIDRYDLWGSVAIPKHHEPDDVPDLYRLATRSGGVFVNPALTEPFGLTLIEAAACGLPLVATHDGGPKDILRHCKNGVLIDPLEADAMGQALEEAISDRRRWKQWSRNGLTGTRKHYAWASHVDKYLRAVRKTWGGVHKQRLVESERSRLPTIDRLLVCDVDDTLLGDREALEELLERLRQAGPHVGFGIATGRSRENLEKLLKRYRIPEPDLLITSVGAEIHYGKKRVTDQRWQEHLDYRWDPKALRAAMADMPGLRLQPKSEQHPFKISYFLDKEEAPSLRDMVRFLRKRDLHANVIRSHCMFLDLLPVRVSKGLALRHVAVRWGLNPERFLVVGGSGNDEGMLRGNTLGVVIGNHSTELERLRGEPRIYFAEGEHARGALEGIDHYDFLGEFRIPEEESQET
ncbi:MAG: HAD-IIB family hydrolase [Gammaproteobacteria bacterium]|nr:HAD-IIB family hydrolase [Gammaproteobacteria bacterium]